MFENYPIFVNIEKELGEYIVSNYCTMGFFAD